MFDPKQIKAFTFDTGGTVLDWHTGFKKGFEKLDFMKKVVLKVMRWPTFLEKSLWKLLQVKGIKN